MLKNSRYQKTAVAHTSHPLPPPFHFIFLGEGPVANLTAHLANPAGANLVTNLGKIGGVTL